MELRWHINTSLFVVEYTGPLQKQKFTNSVSRMAVVDINTNLVVEHIELLQTKTNVYNFSISYGTPLAHQYKPFWR